MRKLIVYVHCINGLGMVRVSQSMNYTWCCSVFTFFTLLQVAKFPDSRDVDFYYLVYSNQVSDTIQITQAFYKRFYVSPVIQFHGKGWFVKYLF